MVGNSFSVSGSRKNEKERWNSCSLGGFWGLCRLLCLGRKEFALGSSGLSIIHHLLGIAPSNFSILIRPSTTSQSLSLETFESSSTSLFYHLTEPVALTSESVLWNMPWSYLHGSILPASLWHKSPVISRLDWFRSWERWGHALVLSFPTFREILWVQDFFSQNCLNLTFCLFWGSGPVLEEKASECPPHSMFFLTWLFFSHPQSLLEQTHILAPNVFWLLKF